MAGAAPIDTSRVRASVVVLVAVGLLAGGAGIRGLTNDGHLFNSCQSEDWARQFRASVQDMAARTEGAILRSRQAGCAKSWRVTLRLRGAGGASVVDAAVGAGWQVVYREDGSPSYTLLEQSIEGETVQLGVWGRADRAVLSAYPTSAAAADD